MVICEPKTTIDQSLCLALFLKYLNRQFYRDVKKIFGQQTTQFGFKSGHSTDLCVYALTEFIESLNGRTTSVYVAFLDESKAFDKINHWVLF